MIGEFVPRRSRLDNVGETSSSAKPRRASDPAAPLPHRQWRPADEFGTRAGPEFRRRGTCSRKAAPLCRPRGSACSWRETGGPVREAQKPIENIGASH